MRLAPFALMVLAGCGSGSERSEANAMIAQAAPARRACPSCSRVTDVEFCAMETQGAAETMAELPMQLDFATRLDGVAVSCSLRSITLSKFISRNISGMRPGWEAMAQSQLNQTICENPLYVVMARRGWRFVHSLYFLSGERVIQTANCPG